MTLMKKCGNDKDFKVEDTKVPNFIKMGNTEKLWKISEDKFLGNFSSLWRENAETMRVLSWLRIQEFQILLRWEIQ